MRNFGWHSSSHRHSGLLSFKMKFHAFWTRTGVYNYSFLMLMKLEKNRLAREKIVVQNLAILYRLLASFLSGRRKKKDENRHWSRVIGCQCQNVTLGRKFKLLTCSDRRILSFIKVPPDFWHWLNQLMLIWHGTICCSVGAYDGNFLGGGKCKVYLITFQFVQFLPRTTPPCRRL